MFLNRGKLRRHNHIYDACAFFSSLLQRSVCFCKFVLVVLKVKMVFALLSPPRGQIENNTGQSTPLITRIHLTFLWLVKMSWEQLHNYNIWWFRIYILRTHLLRCSHKHLSCVLSQKSDFICWHYLEVSLPPKGLKPVSTWGPLCCCPLYSLVFMNELRMFWFIQAERYRLCFTRRFRLFVCVWAEVAGPAWPADRHARLHPLSDCDALCSLELELPWIRPVSPEQAGEELPSWICQFPVVCGLWHTDLSVTCHIS